MARPRLPENEANAQLIQDTKDAKEKGLSYGMYSALCDAGKYKRNLVKDIEQEKRRKENKTNGKETTEIEE